MQPASQQTSPMFHAAGVRVPAPAPPDQRMHSNSHAPLLHTPVLALPPLVGRDLAARVPVFQASGTPLAYMWPPGHSAEPYLGAAHGLVGILYALLLLLQQAAPQCMPNAAADLADIRAALGCVTMLLAWRGAVWRASASACCLVWVLLA